MENEIKIRCSTLTGYSACPRMNAANNFTEIVEEKGFELNVKKSGASANLGTGSHSGVEYNLRHKMNEGKLAPLKDCIDIAIAEFDSLINSDLEIIFDHLTPNVNEAHRQMKEIQRGHYNFFAPKMNPISIENRFLMNLGDGFILSGAPDEIDANKSVQDFKTGKDNNYIAQLGGYNLLARANGFDVNKSVLNCVPRTPKNKIVEPYEVSYHTPTAEKIALSTCNHIKGDITRFNQTANPWEFQANPSNNLCSAKYCRAYGTKFCEYTYKPPIKRKVI